MNKNWNIKNPDPKLQAKFSKKLDVHPIVAQLLINRHITDMEEAKSFLSADLSQLHDPFLLKDMDKGVERIKRALKDKENILVFGDYDVDGVTSSVIMSKVLKKMGGVVYNHIPHRMKHGYGLNHDIGKFALKNKITLLIAVDCGTTASASVDELNKLGVDVIIIDHHESPDHQLPKAVAVINPKQNKCSYPFEHLASVGLVAKFVHALTGHLDENILDLVSIGTIADVVPLCGENRILAKKGLSLIQSTNNVGLKALINVAKIQNKEITPFHVGFILGPRINAAGRMDSAHKSLDLFLCEDVEESFQLAKSLDRHNAKRQQMQREILQEAFELVESEVNFKDQKVIVLSKEGWHKGVLGIVASKITDRYYRPSIVISLEEGIGTASARSIEGFHLHDALSDCSKVLEKFGGHEGAAGLTILEDNIDPFRDLINKVAEDTLEIRKLTPSISIDCEISISSIDLDLANIIASMEPFGEGNPSPVFCTRNLFVKGRPRIMGKETIKFWVTDGKTAISVVGFGMAKEEPLVSSGGCIDIAYQITIDDWNKAPTPQLKLKDIKASEM